MAFKMRGEPLQRNFGIASPNKKIDTETKYLDDKTNQPKTPKMNKEVKPKSTEKPDTSGSRGGRLRTMPKVEVSNNFNPIGSNDQMMYDHLTTEGPQAPEPSVSAPKSKGEQRREARQVNRKAKKES